MAKSEVKWIRLEQLISETDIRNSDGRYTLDNLRGLSIERKFITSKANMDGVSILPYKVVMPYDFCFVTVTSRNSDKITIAQNTSDEDYIVSSSYVTFRVRDTKELLPQYLMMWFNRSEFNRYARFHSWGSAREGFNYDDMCDVQIPIPYTDGKPDLEKQQVVVDAWQGLRKMKEDNEQLVEPLMQLCRSYMESVKKKYNPTHIGPFIEEVDERNTDLSIKLSQGINNKKYFQTPVQVAEDSKSDKIVRKGYFACNRATTRNSDKISIAYRDGEDCTVSSSYQVFRIIDENIINPYFLLLWFKRPEFDRYARFKSRGSAHEFFNFDEMQAVRVPLPDIEMQRAIADIYLCAERAKHIAEEADRLSREICPALMQHIIHEN